VLNGEPHTVIGVTPPEFHMPLDTIEVWMGVERVTWFAGKGRGSGIASAIARMKPGVTLEQARAVQQAVWTVDRDQPMWKVRSMESYCSPAGFSLGFMRCRVMTRQYWLR